MIWIGQAGRNGGSRVAGIFAGDDELDYAFMGTNPEAPDNVWLREAAERQIPIIYFLGVSSCRPSSWTGKRTTSGRASRSGSWRVRLPRQQRRMWPSGATPFA